MEFQDRVARAVVEGLAVRGRAADRITIRLAYCFKKGFMKDAVLNVPATICDAEWPRGLAQAFAAEASSAAEKRGEDFRPENLVFTIDFYGDQA